MSAPPVAPATPHPSVGPALRCPLCGYDLQGLTNPRCPECGHAFEWADLTDPARQTLPWLFEHRRHLRGWLPTQFRLLWPPYFFSRLRPAHRIAIPRLVLFWVLGVVFGLGFVPLAQAGSQALQQTYYWLESHLDREGFLQLVARTQRAFVQYKTEDEVRDMFFPHPLRGRFWQDAGKAIHLPDDSAHLRNPALKISGPTLLAAPAGILTVIAIARQTRRGAGVTSRQLFRVLVYTLDLAPLAWALLAAVGITTVRFLNSHEATSYSNWLGVTRVLELAFLLTWLCCATTGVVMLARFYAAARWYLGFPRPLLISFAAATLATLYWCTLTMKLTDWFWFW